MCRSSEGRCQVSGIGCQDAQCPRSSHHSSFVTRHSSFARTTRYFIVLAAAALCCSGCIQEMADQPRYDPLEQNAAFTDHLLGQVPVRGTIARGQLQLDEPFFTGKADGAFVSELPEEALSGRTPAELLARGRERYTVFCSHCHGQIGGGTGGDPEFVPLVGMVVQRGYPVPPTYHQPRLREAPLGHFFDVITNGMGRMPAHGYMIPPEDRWAIAAYIRALQLSQHIARDALTPTDLEKLAGEN
jgi:mono/diheme cytochrome c family protein